MNRFKWLTIGALVFFISGCTLYSPSSSSGSSDMSSASGDEDASTYGMGMDNNDSMEMLSDDSLSGSLDTIIYFDFDRSELLAEYDGLVSAYAQRLNSNTLATVRLEGHADERGSREYNIGLGERRAQAVRRAMLLNGVAPNQITTVSYGEERPSAYGSDETSYQENRRVEVVLIN
ncbi:MAG: peptidoglycan-associated lipoprotein [Woeseiaceae bacterium]|nr:peptidoglycan-associated lipoprotein [Woeseiaceae bacterium]|tara:strand:- start:742 stop:1269 length:528 start_codon:yes stop_codon:yes gene_type:complete